MKKKIAILPMDTRPCCYEFTTRLGEMTPYEILQPPKDILGGFTNIGNTKKIIHWLKSVAPKVDGMIIAVEQLLFGGLVHSRTLGRTLEECEGSIRVLEEMKQLNPKIKLFVSNVLMRISVTAKSKEYAKYWQKIFDYSQTYDRVYRLKQKEYEEELNSLVNEIPKEVLSDYLHARKRNHAINRCMIQLVEKGIIDYLIILQEDTSPIGVHVQEQRELVQLAFQLKVQNKVMIYPGADEGTQTLLARMLQVLEQRKIKLYPKYLTVSGRLQIPKFEDRPLDETVIAHITAAGGIIVDLPMDADFILFINTPIGQSEPYERANFSSRHLLQPIIQTIQYYLSLNRKVSIADVTFPNGSDREMIQLLLQEDIYFQLHSYAGWNTAGNSLGTTIAHGIIQSLFQQKSVFHYGFLIERLLDDWAYQSNIRKDIIEWVNHQLALDPNNLENEIEQINTKIKELMDPYFHEISSYFAQHMKKQFGVIPSIKLQTCELPWNRVFEVFVKVDLEFGKNN